MSTGRVVIVGGGFAGLSAAYTLNKRGITPLLLEAQERVGGRGSGENVAEARWTSTLPGGLRAWTVGRARWESRLVLGAALDPGHG